MENNLESKIKDVIAQAPEELPLGKIYDIISYDKDNFISEYNYRAVDGAMARCQTIHKDGLMTFGGFRNFEMLYAQYNFLYDELGKASQNIENKYEGYIKETFYSGDGLRKLK